MSKKAIVKVVLAGLVLGIVSQFNIAQPQAATYYWTKEKTYKSKPYHAKVIGKSVSIWNAKHSKEIGNLYDYPHTTWYASATVTMKHGNKKAKYFKVRSGNKKHSGYVWHKNLVKGKFDKASLDSLPPYLYDPMNADLGLSREDINKSLNKQVADLFPGTTRDNQVQLATESQYISVSDILGKDNMDSIINVHTKTKYKGKASGLMSFIKDQVTTELAKQGKTLNDFSGYRIGAYVYPNNNEETKEVYGEVDVYLVPSTVVLPQMPYVIYDPIKGYESASLSGNEIDDELNNGVISLFSNTAQNKQVQLAADLYFSNEIYGDTDGDDDGDYEGDNLAKGILGKDNYKKSTVITFTTNDGQTKINTTKEYLAIAKTKIEAELKKKGKKLSDFKNYHIGAHVVPLKEKHGGLTVVILTPKSAELPKIGKYTFDVNKDSIL